ncbi:MAG: GNAT family N-acetyltransferase [Candidatus Binatia bacterium]
MIKPTIKTATSLNADQAIGTVVLAFSADPAARWLYPDSHQYLMNFPGFVQAFAGKAFEHNSAYCVDAGGLGAALWLPPGVHANENTLIALLQRTVAKEKQRDVFATLEQMDSYHPSESHWYLPMIGVDPAHQAQGYGSALLQHTLLACDRDHKLAYLESSSPKNIPLYERHGFELLGTIQVGKSPPIFPMLRKPRRIVLAEGNDHSSRRATGSAPGSITVLEG